MITLKTLSKATAQEVLDHVVKHLLTQMAKSLGENGPCSYRGINGMSCSGGCLIADDEYSPEMEGHTWLDLVDDGKVPENHSHLITNLQNIHDHYRVDEWLKQLLSLISWTDLNDETIKTFS
jgi:hypothetical protein